MIELRAFALSASTEIEDRMEEPIKYLHVFKREQVIGRSFLALHLVLLTESFSPAFPQRTPVDTGRMPPQTLR